MVLKNALLWALVLALPLSATAQNTRLRHPNDPNGLIRFDATAQILQELHQANLMEIQSGKLAPAKAKDREVRRYAAHLVKDHQVADRKVAALARKQNLSLRNELMPGDRLAFDRLNEASTGPAFDREFVHAQVQGHDKVISRLISVQESIADPPTRSLIAVLLPKLRRHLSEGNQIWTRMQAERTPAASNDSR